MPTETQTRPSETESRLWKAFGISADEHGPSQWYPDSNAELEVICLGFSRTGTTSIRAALDMLGFGPVHHGVELFRRPDHNENMIAFLKYLNQHLQESRRPSPETIERLRKLMRGYRSTLDGPLCDLTPELVAAYPGAKFILTVRDSEAVWWRSWKESVGIMYIPGWRYTIYSSLISSVKLLRRMNAMAQEDNKRLKRDWGSVGPHMYRLHNQQVHDLVPKDRLLEYNVKQGWEPLCRFLEVDVPDAPFPMLNEGASIKAIFLGQQIFGAVVWALYIGMACGAVYLATNPSTLQHFWAGANN
ncbi:NAD dependent epimerase/dehydratase [Cladophialophora carrionii]|uniref:NAD dependent epimerase/dehydratase n=1 Tax=Cladophialophora carrionii TaxID=86049 RepID=A0A1C1CL91_9EURO|nr:NAD dependent epimerase/dehydratase [Cladophialophora carrionii]